MEREGGEKEGKDDQADEAVGLSKEPSLELNEFVHCDSPPYTQKGVAGGPPPPPNNKMKTNKPPNNKQTNNGHLAVSYHNRFSVAVCVTPKPL